MRELADKTSLVDTHDSWVSTTLLNSVAPVNEFVIHTQVRIFRKKYTYLKITQVCFFGSDELENNGRVVEKCACAPKTSFATLAVVT